MSTAAPKKTTRRRPIRKAAKANGAAKAPAFNKGIQAVDPAAKLAAATPDQMQMLMHSNLALWAQCSGLEVDQRPFDFDIHRYLLDIYMCEHKEMAWMKSAQMGATIYEVLRLLWFCRYNTVKAALYFPTGDGVAKLSKDRLNPLIQSNPELRKATGTDDALGLKQIANIHGKTSSLYMMYLGGQASKDSVPLDILGFDEVRLCDVNDIDQTFERIAHSTFKYRMYVSTAGYPNQDIHARFLRGDQRYWHVKCGCPDGFIPSEVFPECIIDTGKEVHLRCPTCKAIIKDAQNGCYIAHNPGADYPSFHISQFISKFITPKEIWQHYNAAVNKKEFYNAKLGKPFVDEENMPINPDVLENCINPELRWLSQSGDRKMKKNCAMGIDQHGGNVYIVISKRSPDGKKQLVHLEIVDSSNPRYWEAGKPVSPFKRAYELMREYDVGLCCIDAMPNYNEAAQMARDFPGRVFIAWYAGEAQKDMVLWHDRARMKEGIRRGSKNIKVKWQVSLNRYTVIDYALDEFVERNVEMPHPDSLVQVIRNEKGNHESENICRTRFWLHLMSIARQKKVLDEMTGRFRMEWVYLGRDPHFVHAWSYCNVAIERLKRQAIILL